MLVGRLRNEYNAENLDEGLKGYIKEKEKDIIFKWQNEKKSVIRKCRKEKREKTNEKMQKV